MIRIHHTYIYIYLPTETPTEIITTIIHKAGIRQVGDSYYIISITVTLRYEFNHITPLSGIIFNHIMHVNPFVITIIWLWVKIRYPKIMDG